MLINSVKDVKAYDAGNSGSSKTVNFSFGNHYKLTLTDDCEITLSAPGPGIYVLQLVQDGTGNRIPDVEGVYWPSGAAPVWASTAGHYDILVLSCDGSDFHCLESALDLQVYTPLSDDLIAYWKFNESSGNAADSSDTGCTLTNNNTVTYAAGKLDNSASFVAASSQYFSASCPAALRLDSTVTKWSVAAWVRLDSVTADQDIMSLFTGDSKTAFEFRFDDAYGEYTDRFDLLVYSDGESTIKIAYSTTEAVADTWYFVVGTFDSVTGALQLYLNGELEGSDTGGAIYTSGTPTIQVGRTGYGGGGKYFNGDIDNLMVFDKVLSQDEVNELYNAGVGTENF